MLFTSSSLVVSETIMKCSAGALTPQALPAVPATTNACECCYAQILRARRVQLVKPSWKLLAVQGCSAVQGSLV